MRSYDRTEWLTALWTDPIASSGALPFVERGTEMQVRGGGSRAQDHHRCVIVALVAGSTSATAAKLDHGAGHQERIRSLVRISRTGRSRTRTSRTGSFTRRSSPRRCATSSTSRELRGRKVPPDQKVPPELKAPPVQRSTRPRGPASEGPLVPTELGVAAVLVDRATAMAPRPSGSTRSRSPRPESRRAATSASAAPALTRRAASRWQPPSSRLPELTWPSSTRGSLFRKSQREVIP